MDADSSTHERSDSSSDSGCRSSGSTSSASTTWTTCLGRRRRGRSPAADDRSDLASVPRSTSKHGWRRPERPHVHTSSATAMPVTKRRRRSFTRRRWSAQYHGVAVPQLTGDSWRWSVGSA